MGNWTTRRACFPPTTSRPWTISSHCPAPDVSVHTCCLCTCVCCFLNGQPFDSLKHYTSPLFASLSHKMYHHHLTSHSNTASLLTLITSLLTVTPPHSNTTSHSSLSHCFTHITLTPPHCLLSHHLTPPHSSLSHHLTPHCHTTSLLTVTPPQSSLSHHLTPHCHPSRSLFILVSQLHIYACVY